MRSNRALNTLGVLFFEVRRGKEGTEEERKGNKDGGREGKGERGRERRNGALGTVLAVLPDVPRAQPPPPPLLLPPGSATSSSHLKYSGCNPDCLTLSQFSSTCTELSGWITSFPSSGSPRVPHWVWTLDRLPLCPSPAHSLHSRHRTLLSLSCTHTRPRPAPGPLH